MFDKLKQTQDLCGKLEEKIKELHKEKFELEAYKEQASKNDKFIKTLELELSGLTRDINELEEQKEKALVLMEHIEEEQDVKFPEVFQVKKEYWQKFKILLT